jgi:heptosyltransferase-3
VNKLRQGVIARESVEGFRGSISYTQEFKNDSRDVPSAPRNVLVFRTGQLGDTIVSLPAIHAIRARYPHHRIVLLTPVQPQGNFVSPLEILGATKIVSEVVTYTPPSNRPATCIHHLALALKIRRLKPEAFFYLRDFPHKNIRRDKFFFKVLAGIHNAYGLAGCKYVFGDRDATGSLVRYPREVDRLLEIVSMADADVGVCDEVNFAIPITNKESTRIDMLFQEISADQLLVAFGPGSKMPSKRWPLDRFIEVGKSLLADFPPAYLIIFGGQEDLPLGEQIKCALGHRVINLAGQLSILESAEALRRCRLYVGNDTGVMHLAAAVGTSCVAIFSSRDHPGRWDPYGRNHIILRNEPACAGCLLEVCTEREMICLKQISVQEVVNAVQQILRRESTVSDARVTEMAIN